MVNPKWFARITLCLVTSFQATAPHVKEPDLKITSVVNRANTAFARNAKVQVSRKRRASHARSQNSRRVSSSTMAKAGTTLAVSTSISVAATVVEAGLGQTDSQFVRTTRIK
jgi:hypothetical protein